MKRLMALVFAAFMAAHGPAHGGSGDGPPAGDPYNPVQFEEYIQKVKDALGEFRDIEVFRRPDPGKPWELVTGRYVPVTVDDKVPSSYHKDMRSDRPMMLPTRVEGFEGGDGQSSPYTVVGRIPGSNPEVQWVFLVRQYSIKKPTDNDFAEAGDMAIIGHHPRTGASTYFQFYEPGQPKSSQVVVSPFNKDGGMRFWAPLDTIAKKFLCQRCHNADAFIHTPWIDQVRVRDQTPGDEFPEPMVPSNPMGPFFFIASEPGELFAHWNDSLRHLNDAENRCTECHRVTPFDLTGLYQNSTRYAGLKRSEYNEFSVEANGFQTDRYRDLQWMPPAAQDNFDFYAAQEDVQAVWHQMYAKSAAEVNKLTPEDSTRLLPVPKPPAQYRSVMVDRPQQDMIEPGQSLWIADMRMRANTDGALDQWRFIGKGTAGAGVQAAPVVYRRNPGESTFKVAFVGAARGQDSAGNWVPVQGEQPFELRQGDYLGVVFTNTGSRTAPAMIPFTTDDWAKPIWSPDGLRFDMGNLDQYVTYRAARTEAPEAGAELEFGGAEMRTYSFEFQNRL